MDFVPFSSLENFGFLAAGSVLTGAMLSAYSDIYLGGRLSMTGFTNAGASLSLTSDFVGASRLSVANTALFGAEVSGHGLFPLGSRLSVLGTTDLSGGFELLGTGEIRQFDFRTRWNSATGRSDS